MDLPRRGSAIDVVIAGKARSQFGVIGRGQLLDLGLTYKAISTRVRRGALEPLFPRAFIIGGAPATWEAKLLAAQLSLGQRAGVSHRSSAAYQGLEGYNPGLLELTLGGSGRAQLKGIRIHRSTTLSEKDLVQAGPFRLTRPERLMIELASVVSPRMLDAAFDSILFKGLSTFPRVAEYLDRVRTQGLKGVSALEQMLDRRDPNQAPAESLFETDFYRLLRDSPWANADFQFEVFDEQGFVGRLDVAYPACKVGIEAQSYRYHSPRERMIRDDQRHNRLASAGWRVLYESYEDLIHKPDEILARLDSFMKLSA